MSVLSPSGMWGEAGPPVSSIETSGWQPRQTSWLMILNAEVGWLLSLGRAPAAIGAGAGAAHPRAGAVAPPPTPPATAAKPDALTMTIPGCSVNLRSMTQ